MSAAPTLDGIKPVKASDTKGPRTESGKSFEALALEHRLFSFRGLSDT